MPLILLDKNVPVPLRRLLPGHEVRTTDDHGWGRLTNGELLGVAEEAGYCAMVTADRNIRYQQNLATRRIGLVVLSTNIWRVLRADLALIRSAVDEAGPSTYREIVFPLPPLRRRPRSNQPGP